MKSVANRLGVRGRLAWYSSLSHHGMKNGSGRSRHVIAAQHFSFCLDPVFEVRTIRSTTLFVEFVCPSSDPFIEFGGLSGVSFCFV
jgi:hypothetical protein